MPPTSAEKAAMLAKIEARADRWAKFGTAIVSIPTVVIAVIFETRFHEFGLTLAWILMAGLLGCLVGTLATPFSRKEEKRFSAHARLVGLFVSGYLAAWLNDAIKGLLAPGSLSGPVALRLALGFAMLFGAMIVTYYYRLQWIDDDE
jgi:hypothetical protein